MRDFIIISIMVATFCTSCLGPSEKQTVCDCPSAKTYAAVQGTVTVAKDSVGDWYLRVVGVGNDTSSDLLQQRPMSIAASRAHLDTVMTAFFIEACQHENITTVHDCVAEYKNIYSDSIKTRYMANGAVHSILESSHAEFMWLLLCIQGSTD